MLEHMRLSKYSRNQAGFSVAEVLIVIVVALALLVVGQFVFRGSSEETGGTANNPPAQSQKAETHPPLKLKSVGILLDSYSPASNKAGDLQFTQAPLLTGLIFTDYGYEVPASLSDTGTAKRNPQPTFLVPLGTPVRSLVDGEVVKVEKLYSGDYAIHVAANSKSRWVYELEHVSKPRVTKGDEVTAGQILAEVSSFDSQKNGGLGMFEIGILHTAENGAPEHVCPFNYLDPSIEQNIFSKLNSLYREWETYRGDTTLYDQDAHAVPGCYTLEAIKG